MLVVGINPANPAHRSKNGTINRLARWMDVVGLKNWSFVNCVASPGPYSMRDVEHDYVSACARGYDKVIALGNFPSAVLARSGIQHFCMPHPSGLNRKLNDAGYEAEQLHLCKEYVHG